MTRYLRLYAYFLRFSFSRAMEFRVDFYFRIFMDAVWYAVNLTFFTVLFHHTGLLGGWTYDQVLIFAGGVFVADAAHMTIFANNMWWLPILINKGDLDYYLVRPVSSLFFVSLRDFAANSFVNLLMAGGILIWALARYPGELGFGQLGFYAFLMGLGILLNYVVQLIFLIPVFWMHTGDGLRQIWFSLEQYSGRPDRIYTGWLRRILTSILPFALIISFPTQGLFAPTWTLAAHMLLVTALAFAFAVWFWNRGLKAYASASS